MVIVYVLIAVVVVILIAMASMYNGLKILRNRVENAWSQIDVQLKRRYDLIPNLVETVKGYAAHEKDTLERVIQARNMAISAKGVKEQGEAENMLTGALKSIFALAESYPNLKANENFMMLQEELAGTEGKIAFARQFHNDCVMKYQTKKELFPTNIVAGMFSFPNKEYFEIEAPAERQAPKVSFTGA
ncbi:MAG: LemA family protein [Verrucomicrobia bacterium]|nr:LemA family protein [Verrucomicrobiota bacterium]